MRHIYMFFSSLRLTVVLLSFSMVLVFFGTLDQSRWGIYETQRLYFESFVVMTPVLSLMKMMAGGSFEPSLAWFEIPLPGGFLLGGLLLINLCCAHFRYFKPSWRKVGVALTHGGVVLLLVSGFLIAFLQEESQMFLDEGGQPVNFSTDFRYSELVLIDTTEDAAEQVISIPQSLLAEGGTIELPDTDMSVRVEAFAPNAGAAIGANLLQHYEQMLQNPQVPAAQKRELSAAVGAMKSGEALVLDTEGRTLLSKGDLPLKGFAQRIGGVIQKQPLTFEQDTVNIPAAVVSVLDKNSSPIGTWMVSAGFAENIPAQTLSYEDRQYEIALRHKRHYYPFWIQLQDFSHDKYPGTEIPMNFSSDIFLKNPEDGTERPVKIYMNNPLRYEGLTFFQQSFMNEDTTSILMVVRNPVWTWPYIAVALVGLGMCVQFGTSLLQFSRRKEKGQPA